MPQTNRAHSATEYTNARIRIDSRGAHLLKQLLLAEEHRVLVARTNTFEGSEERYQCNQQLYTVRRVWEELRRTMDENSW